MAADASGVAGLSETGAGEEEAVGTGLADSCGASDVIVWRVSPAQPQEDCQASKYENGNNNHNQTRASCYVKSHGSYLLNPSGNNGRGAVPSKNQLAPTRSR